MTSTLGYKISETMGPSMQRVMTNDMRWFRRSIKPCETSNRSHPILPWVCKTDSRTKFLELPWRSQGRKKETPEKAGKL
jgi:hypothetical protein